MVLLVVVGPALAAVLGRPDAHRGGMAGGHGSSPGAGTVGGTSG
jgi:hypothetical protein